MRTAPFALVAVLLITGCQQIHSSPKLSKEDQLRQALEEMVEKPLENSPSFKELKRRTKQAGVDWDILPDVDVQDGWVKVDIFSFSEDGNFSHRWASLEVQTNSGVILKEGEDENLEIKLFPEFLPPAPPVDTDFPAYRKRVLEIQQRIGPRVYQERILKTPTNQWFSDDYFFGDTNFIALYEHPVECASNAVRFLNNSENPDDAKLVVVYTLQRLPLDQYLEFESELIDMAEMHQISSNLLNGALFPVSDWSTKIQRNFSAARVKDLIAKMGKCGEINSENKAYLKKITSGKARDDIQELQELRYLPADSDQAGVWPMTSGDKAFYEQIKKAVLSDDFDWFASAVDYPIQLGLRDEHHWQGRTVRIRTQNQLRKYKSLIFSEHLRNVVRNQSADSLFKNWQGLMVGNGEIWFDQIRREGETNWTYKIVTFNLIADENLSDGHAALLGGAKHNYDRPDAIGHTRNSG